jgi:hypothetical protein
LTLGVLPWSARIRAVYGNHEELCGVGKWYSIRGVALSVYKIVC